MYDVKIDTFSFSKYPNIVIDSIEGFGPPSATISTQKLGKNGEMFTGATLDKRNIVINFSIINYVKATREAMYSALIVGEEVTITVDGNKKTSGYIETFEMNNFQNLTTGQISIICPSPYFLESATTSVSWNSSNSATVEVNIENDYLITVSFTGTASSFSYKINNTTYRINYSFKSGDILTINSENRKILVNGNNIYGAKTWTTWGLLRKGTNNISYTNNNCQVTFEYANRYLAI